MSWRDLHESVSVRVARRHGWTGDGGGFCRGAFRLGTGRAARPSARPTMSWTDERVELLRQLWLDGRSASQISAQLGHGVTRNAVIGKVHRLGLAGRAKAPAAASSPPRQAPAARAPSRSGGGGGV